MLLTAYEAYLLEERQTLACSQCGGRFDSCDPATAGRNCQECFEPLCPSCHDHADGVCCLCAFRRDLSEAEALEAPEDNPADEEQPSEEEWKEFEEYGEPVGKTAAENA